MRSKLLLIMAVIMGLATTFLFYRYMNQFHGSKTAAPVKMVNTIIAKQAIGKNQIITTDMLEKVKLPEAAPLMDGLTNSQEIVGKIAKSEIAKGEVIPASRLTDQKEEDHDVALKIRDGYRAVSVGVNFVQSVSNLIEPGDRVDVISSIVNPVTKAVKTTLLLENVRVLAVGRRMVESDKTHPYAQYSSATLELNSGDTVKVVDAAAKGTITLAIYTKVKAAKSNASGKEAKPNGK